MSELDPEEPRHEARVRVLSDEDIQKQEHRRLVGGQWNVMGWRQLSFLKAQGLRPEHRLLDVGCGSLRAGRHFVGYLRAGNYYGIDHSEDLLTAGWEHELSPEQRAKLPRENLLANGAFRVQDLGQQFDYAIANSLFTHIGLSMIRLCVYRVAQVLAPGGKFYVTFFEQPPDTAVDSPGGGGQMLRSFRNPYWNFVADLEWVTNFAPVDFTYIGDWNHPLHQKIGVYTRH